MTAVNFDSIRSYRDHEVHDTIKKLVVDPIFLKVVAYLFPDKPTQEIVNMLLSVTTVSEFQEKFSFEIVNRFLAISQSEVTLRGKENLQKDVPYLYISNHRDIVLDASILSWALFKMGRENTTEVAIGDNLLIYDSITDFVKLNRSFVVRRNTSVRETLLASQELSAYIRNCIQDRNMSVWLAQREGRAKNSDDRTQESLLKMLNMSGESSILDNLASLSICPLSISYEYDPCDYLKAQEFQLKRDKPDYKKTPQDDLLNMMTGIQGKKGRIAYHFGIAIAPDIKALEQKALSKGEQLKAIAELIDTQIHRNYEIYPINKLAYDRLLHSSRFEKECTAEEKATFDAYLQQQLAKITLPRKDEAFLTTKLLEMYANPLINKLAAEKGK